MHKYLPSTRKCYWNAAILGVQFLKVRKHTVNLWLVSIHLKIHIGHNCPRNKNLILKGVCHEVFDFSFFHESVSPGPLSIPSASFRLFRKFAEIIANEFLSVVSMTPAINCSAVSMTLLTNLLAVSLTTAINLCHRFSLIGGVVNTGDKFIIGFIDTAENDRQWQWHWW